MPRRFALVLVLVLGACSGRSAAAPACGEISREPLDPSYLVHVLPGAPAPHYRTDPPTSGPHQPAPALGPVQTRPLPRPVQVGVLEGGRVLVQYRGVRAADVRAVRALAGARVVVAPNPDLARPGIVATAWVYKRSCRAFDRSALQAFIDARAGKGA